MRPALVHKKARRGSGSVQAMRDDCLRAAPADRGGKTRKIVAASDPGGLLCVIMKSINEEHLMKSIFK